MDGRWLFLKFILLSDRRFEKALEGRVVKGLDSIFMSVRVSLTTSKGNGLKVVREFPEKKVKSISKI